MRTRQEARGLETREGKKTDGGQIPDIVITNYSMLEYMLCRPQDAVFFGNGLRALVLDEAHLYTGTLAAEITLLLRRLYARCGVQPQQVLQIATSATLGRGSDDELRQFAARLFSKNESLTHVITGRQARAVLGDERPPTAAPTPAKFTNEIWLDEPLLVADKLGNVTLNEAPALCDRLHGRLRLLTTATATDGETRPSVVLRQALAHAPLIHSLERSLWESRHVPLPILAQSIWGNDDPSARHATITLLQLAASARNRAEEYPLVPHRLHLLVRPTDGLSLCLNPKCSGPNEWKLQPLGCVAAGLMERCEHCSAAMLSLFRCPNCGEWLLGGRLQGNRYVAATQDSVQLCFLTARPNNGPDQTTMTLRVETAERGGIGAAGVQVATVSSCPHCGADSTEFQPFSSGTPLTLAIVAESVLAGLPAYPAKHNPYLPARGRRLLAFSDSRQEAARLGPRLTRQHETQLVRAIIVQSLGQELAADRETIAYLSNEIQRLTELLKGSLTPALRQRAENDLRLRQQELRSHCSGGTMASWAQAIGNSGIAAEILDIETGQKHAAREELPDGKVREWSQRDWERNWDRIKDQAVVLLAREFATPSWRANSTETLGLAEITYPGLDSVPPPAEFLGTLPDELARAAVAEYWSMILLALCDTLRVDGAITLGNDDADRNYESGGVPLGRWASRSDTGPGLIRFVGETPEQRRRRFIAAVLRAAGYSLPDLEQVASQLLGAAFDALILRATPLGQQTLGDQFTWLQRHERQNGDGVPQAAIRIVFTELGLRRTPELFRCQKTGHIWPRSVAGCAPEVGCERTLEPVTDDLLDGDARIGRLRKEYRDSAVFQIGLWAEEHSAQLSPRENRRLQDLFKAGIRNILSATTTLELGIDIGGLTAALMSNVPPGKANYLQRAGRAGRRADGSAAVVTFARPRPFDREVFRRFGDYLGQPLRRPLVFLDRERVVRRHLHAYLLGEFFRTHHGPDDRRGAMNAFGNMGQFCGKASVPYWKDLNDPPTLSVAPPSLEARFRNFLFRLRDYGDEGHQNTAASLFADSALQNRLSDWSGLMGQTIDEFSRAIQDWTADYDLLLRSWLDAVDVRAKPQANAIRYQIKLLCELTVIEALADRQFLPRYGFPIGLQKLRVIAPDERDRNRFREEDQYRLERAGLLAIGEYVPGSQLLAAGKLITSRGLLKHWTGSSLDSSPGLRGRFCRCENDHDYYWIAGSNEHCPICNGQPKHAPQELLFVKYGFTSAAWDPPKWSTDVERIGSAETISVAFRPHAPETGRILRPNFAGIAGLLADYREEGELLVFNRGENQLGFAICLKCGYSQSEPARRAKGKMDLPRAFTLHAPITSTRPWDVCWRDGDASPVLRNQLLAARESTDVLLLDFSECLGLRAADESLIITLAYAFQRAAAQLLELDPRELGVLTVPTGEGGATRGAVIYDNVPGGAGHVRELLAIGEEWLAAARAAMYVSGDHDRRCESACLDCLLTFDAQRAMSQRPFVRRLALQCLDRLLG
jgi:Lhr-like helicase